MRNRRNIILNLIYIAVGVVLVILSVSGTLDDIYLGFGEGLAVVGIIQLVKHMKYRNDAEYREKVDVEVNDERNRYLRLKAWSWAGYLFVIISGAATIICMIMSQTFYMQIAAFCICLIIILYWISYMILKKKY